MAALRVPDHRFVLLLFSDSLPFLHHPLLPFILTPLVRPPPRSPMSRGPHCTLILIFPSTIIPNSWHFSNIWQLSPHYFICLPFRIYLLSSFRSGHEQALAASPCDVSVTSSLLPKQRHTWLHCKFNRSLQPIKYHATNWAKQQELEKSCVLCLCIVHMSDQHNFLIPSLLKLFFLFFVVDS